MIMMVERTQVLRLIAAGADGGPSALPPHRR
jgi:hypothetical protein